MKKISVILITVCLGMMQVYALPNKGANKRPTGLNKTAAGCNPTTAVIDLDVNNVRAHLMNGGDMWWDRPTGSASYEVPKGSNKNSLFAGSIWIGGKDQGGAIRVAAQTYRQSGNDYWSGPLDVSGSVDFQTCNDWDRFWKINASDVSAFRGLYAGLDPVFDSTAVRDRINTNLSNVPAIIKEWPARGNKGIKTATGGAMPTYNQDLAEFVDVNPNDGEAYNWRNGDYPKISGDQYIWWVFNDVGDAKTETTSESMNLEIHAAAFAFATNDCLNEATFYNYKIRSLSSYDLTETYMATWCDADLGNAFDDYVGCDTSRGLGILYNGDAYDDGAGGYGFEIPMIGVDYFQGPRFVNPISGKDTELKMTVFTYYDNEQNVPTGNPDVLDDYYQFITGFWKDGQPFTTACNARNPGPATKFIFYGDNCKGGWTEASCANTPNDRRFIHSSGPFTLKQGAAPNNITIGAVWVPNVGGGKAACFSKIQICDDKAQDLFNNNFKLPFGPQAPNVVVQPLDKRLVFDLDNLPVSNNFKEGYGTDFSNRKYIEVSKKAYNAGYADSTYKFEGYLVYQLKNANVALSDIRSKDGSINTDKARLVFQCDKKNGIKQLVNFEQSTDINKTYFDPKLMVEGADRGIQHSFDIAQDAFATGTSKSLVNYKYYYYVVLAYAYNNFRDFDEKKTDSTQDKQYLESRTDGNEQPIKIIKAMPHPATDSLYIQNYADYGTGLQLTRLEGIGNGGFAMELTEESEMQALTGPNYKSATPTYQPNRGPMKMVVVNPDSLKPGNYEVWFQVDSSVTTTTGEVFNSAVGARSRWFVKRTDGSIVDTIYNEASIDVYSEKYLRKYKQFNGKQTDWGLSGAAVQQIRPGDNPISTDNGLISSSILFDDVNNAWLSGVRDEDGESLNNWIRAGSDFQGSISGLSTCEIADWDNYYDTDSNKAIYKNPDQLATFEKVISGTWSPYNLVTNSNLDECGWGLMYGNGNDRGTNKLQNIYSVDIVFTADKSKWSRCPVIEMTDNVSPPISEGGAYKYNLRKHAGWNGEWNSDGTPKYSTNPADSGMSLFPGYAINIETGERLNICFGEESFNVDDNGNDMIWNPTNREYDPISRKLKWAGKHVVYISRLKYDGGQWLADKMRVNSSSGSKLELRDAYKTMMWVGVPKLRTGSSFTSIEKGMIPNTCKIKVRVSRPYAKYVPVDSASLRNNGWPIFGFSTNNILPAKIGDSRNDYTDKKDEVFKRIHVVPNPYYAYSEYEEQRLENKVRIINLPEKAIIKIFTSDGVLIKTIRKNDAKTNFVDWDIKNEQGIPIASGMYLVHVNLEGIGETILKWFGAMRPLDITSF